MRTNNIHLHGNAYNWSHCFTHFLKRKSIYLSVRQFSLAFCSLDLQLIWLVAQSKEYSNLLHPNILKTAAFQRDKELANLVDNQRHFRLYLNYNFKIRIFCCNIVKNWKINKNKEKKRIHKIKLIHCNRTKVNVFFYSNPWTVQFFLGFQKQIFGLFTFC